MPTRDEQVYIRVEKNEHLGAASPGTPIPGVLFRSAGGCDQHQYLDRARDSPPSAASAHVRPARPRRRGLYEKVRARDLRDVLAAHDSLASQSSVDSTRSPSSARHGGHRPPLTAMRPVKWPW
jgi:hypothetical protein